MADNTKPDLEGRLARLEEAYTTSSKENAELRAQLSKKDEPAKEQELPKLSDKTFTVDKKNYKFTVPHFRHNGKVITNADALSDKDILADLVSRGSGVIVEVAEK